ncbi:olfactory receptor 1-like [Erpetoichthys calabaricus]|uniref:olfactory receptor 1-like n=1 Tax=Erpetoichthys calabaricus TaxID=27687 RepID=UPI002234D0B5|nr:olfactory receptor 1-like [Erpetoichthys calabaricus]
MRNSTITVTEFVLNCMIEDPQSNNAVYIFSLIYLVTFIGNVLVILVITMNHHLRTPMYLYIGTLAVMDLINSTTVLPKLVAVLLHYSAILYGLCVLQMSLISYIKVAITFLFAIMACDRYIAILYPLRYPSVITTKTVWTAVFLLHILSTALILPYVFLVSDLSFCQDNVLPSCFCSFFNMMDVSCDKDSKYVTISFAMVALCGIGPLVIIVLSYIKIAQAALKISSVAGKQKIFTTCVTHLIVIGMFYFPLLIFYVLPETGVKLSTETSNVLVIIAHAIPSMMNPIIYSFRNTEIKSSIFNIFLTIKQVQLLKYP